MPTTQLYQTYYQDTSGTRVAGWKNKAAQFIRFEQLAKLIEPPQLTHFSVNDLGCGPGHFSAWLADKFEDFKYSGYDVLPEMIEEADRLFGDQNQVRFFQIGSAADMEEATFTVASGIFNLRFEETDAAWQAYLLETLQAMHKKSRVGFAFNCLSRYSDAERMEPSLYYADPCFLFDFCKRNFSRNIALLHDYQEYDFTILVRK